MKPTDIKEKIIAKFADAVSVVENTFGDLVFETAPENLVALVDFLKHEATLQFNQLLDIAGVDNLKRFPEGVDGDDYDEDRRFEAVYIFNSIPFNHRIRIKVSLPEDKPSLPTLTKLYKSADWGEREVYDLFGIHFEDHPNLKRILTHYKFVGHALRKDYATNKEQPLDAAEPLIDELLLNLKNRNVAVRWEDE